MIPPSLSLSLFIFLHGEEVNSSFVLACRASKAKLFQEERGCRYISRIDFPPYFCLLRISVGEKKRRRTGGGGGGEAVVAKVCCGSGWRRFKEGNNRSRNIVWRRQPFCFFEKSLAEHLYTL